MLFAHIFQQSILKTGDQKDPTGKCDEEFINTSKIIESKIKDLAERIKNNNL